MADTHPSLHIDDDWKKQAQEEKRKLAEAEAEKKAQASAASAVTSDSGGAGSAIGGTGKARRQEAPPANFPTLVQTLMTQALFYLGELGNRNGQTMVDLDMAKSQVDLLGVLEDKTKGNLTGEEQQMIDSALYETRMRFVAVAREYVDLSSPR